MCIGRSYKDLHLGYKSRQTAYPITMSSRPIDPKPSRPIKGPKGRPIKGPAGRPIKGPKGRPIQGPKGNPLKKIYGF